MKVRVVRYRKNTNLKAIHNSNSFERQRRKVVRYRKNTNLKAIHNFELKGFHKQGVVRYRKNTNLKAIHNYMKPIYEAAKLLDTAKIQI